MSDGDSSASLTTTDAPLPAPDRAWDRTPIGLNRIALDGTILWANHAELNLLGYSAEEYLGHRLQQFHVTPVLVEGALQKLRAGQAVRDCKAYVRTKRGGVLQVALSLEPSFDGGEVIHGQGFTREVPAKRPRTSPFARAESLLKVTAALADAVTAEDVFEALVDRVVDAVGASSAGLWLVGASGEAARLVRARGYSGEVLEQIGILRMDADPGIPALDCLRDGQPIWISSQADLLARYPHLASMVSPEGGYRSACLPLTAQGRVLGDLALTIEDEQKTTDDERDILLLVGRFASQALERLRLLDAERASRAEADAAAGRLALLNRASTAFSETDLDFDARLRRVAAELSEAMTSSIDISLVEADGLLRSKVVHRPSPREDGAGGGLDEAIAPRATIESALRVHGRVVGVVTATSSREGQTFTRGDLALLEELGERAAVAIENARLHQETQEARARAEQLYRFAQSVVAADRVEVVFDAAFTAIEAGLGATRAAILTFDAGGVMRFRAWRHLSDAYRAAVEGHSPWPREASAPEPVLVPDVAVDRGLEAFRPLFVQEGIGALSFIPLVMGGRLIGKFMVYYDRPHAFALHEIETARAIGNHLASVIHRFSAMTKLEETVRDNELFAAVLAHDLRNPLSAMVTAAHLVLARQGTDGAVSAKDLQPLGRVITIGGRMTAMIDQLLDVARARSGGGIEVRPRPADLGDLCAQAVGELELTWPECKIERHVTGDQGGTWDPDRLLQVFSNLVGNACQHGDPRAGISIALDGSDAEAVTFAVHNAGSIPEPRLPELFDAFRITRHRRDHSRGLGLGLFIVQEVVRAHGGTVEVTSSDPEGTTFRVRLPRHATARDRPTAANPG